MKCKIRYYNGQVQKGVDKFPVDIRVQTHKTIALLEEFGSVAIPNRTKVWEGDIWEITANDKSGWGRVMFISVDGDTIWLLFSYLKTTNRTPNHIAKEVRKRAKEVKA